MSNTQEPDPLHEPVRHERWLIAQRLRELPRVAVSTDDQGGWWIQDYAQGQLVWYKQIQSLIKELEK